jgi:hypothetical protein
VIDSVQIILESTDLKQDLFLGENFNWYLRKGNPTNEKMFSFMLQYELAKIHHIDCDKPVMLDSPNGKYLGLKTSRLDDRYDGSFRFEYNYKKKDFINENQILRIVFLNYIFNIGKSENALVFNRQDKILVKRGYSDDLICTDRTRYLSLPLYRMMCNSVSFELFESELNMAIVLCDKLLHQKVKNLVNYFKPNQQVSNQILSTFDSSYLEIQRLELLNQYYIHRK